MEHFDWIKGFVFPYINFFIYLALLYFLAKPAINKMLVAKHDAFQVQIKEAQKAKLQAEEQAKILATKLAGLDREIAVIIDNAKKTAESEAQAILKSAEHLAEHIRTEAKRLAHTEVANAKLSIQKEIIQQVTEEVAARMSKDVTAEQHAAIAAKNIETLKTVNARSLV